MRRQRRALAVLLLGATALAPSTVDAGGGHAGHGDGHQHGHHGQHGHHDSTHGHHDDRHAERRAVRTVRRATSEYRQVAAAERHGYGQFLTCTREPGVGAMGTHWVNGDLVGDTVLDPKQPEAMVYETNRNGKLQLVAVEYVVFRDAWDAEHTAPPELFGQEFHVVEAPNRFGLPSFYALHVWAWKHNPDGVFASWNPHVSCRYADGDPI